MSALPDDLNLLDEFLFADDPEQEGVESAGSGAGRAGAEPSTPLGWALRFAEAGVPVFPVKITRDPSHPTKTNKRPLTRHGHHDASTDADTIRRWWAEHPEAAIGGHLAALDVAVIDVDVAGGKRGDDQLHELERRFGALADGVRVVTPSGGTHIYVAMNGTRIGCGNLTALGAEHVDVKGDGGWLVLPGSQSPLGEYQFEADASLLDGVGPAPAPSWLAGAVPAGGGGGSVNGAAAGSWRRLGESARADLDPLNLEALEALEALGGHDPIVLADGTVQIVRPGKRAGMSASVGKIAPGVVRVFSTGWPGLPEGRYDLDQLVDGDAAGAQVDGFDGEPTHRLVAGGSFVYDVPDQPPALWGEGDRILWAEGEALMVAGPTGVGKSTLTAQLVGARLGILDALLGFDVQCSERPVLYLAMDRPPQIRRLLHRLFVNYDAREILDERLRVWQGPLPATLNADPSVLVRLATQVGAGTVVVDSLKDAAVKLTDDEAGGNINRAFQMLTAEGVELAVLHHQRKTPADGGKAPKALDDIYGSALIPAGMGSVVALWGQAGDPVVELLHLKQPSETVGPFKIEHDHLTGLSRVTHGFDALAFLRHRGTTGATSRDAAVAMFEKQNPTRAEQARARRQLDRLVREMPERVTRDGPATGGDGGSTGATYTYVDLADDLVSPRTPPRTQGSAT